MISGRLYLIEHYVLESSLDRLQYPLLDYQPLHELYHCFLVAVQDLLQLPVLVLLLLFEIVAALYVAKLHLRPRQCAGVGLG